MKNIVEPLALALGAAILATQLITSAPTSQIFQSATTSPLQAVLSAVKCIVMGGWGLVLWGAVKLVVNKLEVKTKKYYKGKLIPARNTLPTDVLGGKIEH